MGLLLNEILTVVLLLTLGLGYIVFYLANREEKGLKLLGIGIGAFMIVFSILLILGNAVLLNMGSGGCARRGMSGKEMLMRKQMMMQKQMMQQMRAPAGKALLPSAKK